MTSRRWSAFNYVWKDFQNASIREWYYLKYTDQEYIENWKLYERAIFSRVYF